MNLTELSNLSDFQYLVLGLNGAVVLLLVAVAYRLFNLRDDGPEKFRDVLAETDESLDLLSQTIERQQQAVQLQIADMREENARHDSILRQELQGLFGRFGESTGQRMSEIAHLQKNQLDGFSRQLHDNLQAWQKNLNTLQQSLGEKQDTLRSTLIQQQAEQREAAMNGMRAMQDGINAKLDSKLKELREENSVKLEEMRRTVDEKLQGTLEKRLGESFKQVSERLEQVHRGLGEMQTLASGVGDLKRVLTNVKTRGSWGEFQLRNLIEEMLTADQFIANAKIQPNSREHVEFAIPLPGRDDDGKQVLLPIDAKFPKEDYDRLLDAQEAADPIAAETAARQLEMAVKKSARDIAAKYIHPPHSTDFAILFLPSEGLFAEVIRRPGLMETIRRESHVVITGPTTFTSVLHSLQMGFRTLAIEKRSSEVWRLLSDVKSEFGKFGGALEKVKKKLQEASNQVEGVETRTRVMGRKLKNVEELMPNDSDAPPQLDSPANNDQ